MNEIHEAGAVATKQFTTHDADYTALLEHMKKTLVARTEADGFSLFRTSVKALTKNELEDFLGQVVPATLNGIYLGSLTDEVQYHTCTCCSGFLKRYGGLVTIDEQGVTHSAVWDASTFPQDNFYYPVVKNLQKVVERGSVHGAHRSTQAVWGDFVKGGFSHFAIQVPEELIYREADQNSRQKQAALLEDYKRVVRVLHTDPAFSLDNLTKLMQLLNSEALKGAEKIQGAGRWLYQLASERAAAKDAITKKNLMWRAIATAPAGWANSNNNVINTVLEDLLEGTSFSVLARKYVDKVQADVYQHSIAPPKLGAVDAAEKLFEKMGLAPSLRRRVATMDDIPDNAFMWRESLAEPEEKDQGDGSIFGKLRNKIAGKDREELKLPPVTMSWNKFVAEIFPEVSNIEIYVPAQTDIFSGLVTAAVADAPPILIYDYPESRNPVSTYARYAGRDPISQNLIGVHPASWNLEVAKYHQVKALLTSPHCWGGGNHPQWRDQVYFVIEGAYDKALDGDQKGLVLFPEILKSELHSVKRVIEAYSNDGYLEGAPSQQVAGLAIAQGNVSVPRRLRVQTKLGAREVIIDRWE